MGETLDRNNTRALNWGTKENTSKHISTHAHDDEAYPTFKYIVDGDIFIIEHSLSMFQQANVIMMICYCGQNNNRAQKCILSQHQYTLIRTWWRLPSMDMSSATWSQLRKVSTSAERSIMPSLPLPVLSFRKSDLLEPGVVRQLNYWRINSRKRTYLTF